MLIPVELLKRKFDVKPESILHVGAHQAEELDDYIKTWGPLKQPIYWIEGQEKLAQALKKRLNSKEHEVIQTYVWNKDDVRLEFNVASNSQSSSLLKFGTHEEKSPDVKFTEKVSVRTRRLDSILPPDMNFDFINLDLQGVELQALQGMDTKLNAARWIYSEVNQEQVYEGCTEVTELDSYLSTFGFQRIATRWTIGHGWGDALYIRKPSLRILFGARMTFRVRECFRSIYIKRKLKNKLKK